MNISLHISLSFIDKSFDTVWFYELFQLLRVEILEILYDVKIIFRDGFYSWKDINAYSS